MQRITELKTKANEKFKNACSAGEASQTGNTLLREACMIYAQAIEAIGSFEIDLLEAGRNAERESDPDFQQIEIVKPQLFLNLGMANAKLKDFTSCRRCCNVALYFCNESYVPLCDLPSITNDMDLLLPVVPTFNNMISKILFHRSRCIAQLESEESALSDLRLAFSLNPSDAVIKNSIADLEKVMFKDNRTDFKPTIRSNKNAKSKDNSFNGGGGMFNGGFCLERTACWSQSVYDVTVTIPLESILPDNTVLPSQIKLTFNTNNMRIFYRSHCAESEIFCMNISGGSVIPRDCSWYFSNCDSVALQFEQALLVVVLEKLPPHPEKTFPGCEWWSHVFEGDEKIETLTCTIGADICSLPSHALERRDKEHARFMALSKGDQKEELAGIIGIKKAFINSEQNTREAANLEDRAIDDVPQRAELLEILGKEFPHIQFSAK